MGVVLGLNGKAYRNVGGTYAAPTWSLIDNIRDVTLNLEKGEADVTTRGAQGWRLKAFTLKEGTLDFQMVWDTGDADFTAFKDAYFNDTPILCWFADGLAATTGSQGLKAWFSVGNFTRNEQLEEAMLVDVSLAPTFVSGEPPTWYVVP